MTVGEYIVISYVIGIVVFNILIIYLMVLDRVEVDDSSIFFLMSLSSWFGVLFFILAMVKFSLEYRLPYTYSRIKSFLLRRFK